MAKTLTIRYTSDIHGYFYPTNYADTQLREMGLMRLYPEYPRDDNTLILDGGDTIQGSPLTNYYHQLKTIQQNSALSSRRYGSNPMAAMMNLAGYQYITLGNHDFNYGLESLGDYLNNLNAQCLCANIRDKAGQLPIAPYAIHTLGNGLRVGLVGVCTQYVPRWEKAETAALLDVQDAFETARDVLSQIRDRCDLTVLLYHGGYERDLDTGRLLTDSNENEAWQICQELDYDLVLTGHQHIALSGRMLGNSFTTQPTYRAPHACAVTVTVHDDGTKDFSGTLLPATAEAPAEALELLAPLEHQVQTWLDTPAGELHPPLPSQDHLYAALHGNPLSNFINMVQLEASGADVAACALPNEYKGFPAKVTIRDIVSTYIYSNTLVVLDMNGASLRKYMERTACYFDYQDGTICLSEEFMRPKHQHYNYDYFMGVDYVLDISRPVGSRVVSLKKDGHELADDEPVSVCINSYRYHGTSGYDMLPVQKVLRDIQLDVADAIIDYILTHRRVDVDLHRYFTILPEQP